MEQKQKNPKFFCQLDVSEIKVGQTQTLICEDKGFLLKNKKKEDLKIIWPSDKLSQSQYKLVILDAISKPEEKDLELKVTSYRTGKHENLELGLFSMDDNAKVTVTSFEVKSVLTQNSQPLPHYGFEKLLANNQNIYIAATAFSLFFVAFLVWLIVFFNKRLQLQKKMRPYKDISIKHLAKKASKDFINDLHQIRRRYPQVFLHKKLDENIIDMCKDLEESFSKFLLKKYQILSSHRLSVFKKRIIKNKKASNRAALIRIAQDIEAFKNLSLDQMKKSESFEQVEDLFDFMMKEGQAS